MSERFERIFSLKGNLYAVDAPIIISAGVLLRDTETGRLFVQLKLKNIDPRPIKAVKVKVTPLDTVGKPFGEEILFDYLDFYAQRDVEFGQKKAIPVSNAATRAFAAEVAEVAFEDNSVWTSEGKTWEPLQESVPLEKMLGYSELVKQYRIWYGRGAKYEPMKGDGIWFCTCGAVNSVKETNCHSCGVEAVTLFNCNLEKLKGEASERAEQDRKAKQEELLAKKAKAKKRNNLLAIIVSAAVVCIAAVLITKVVVPDRKYKQAEALLESGKYVEAIDAFTSLKGYKDSKEQIIIAKKRLAEESLPAEKNDPEDKTVQEAAEQIRPKEEVFDEAWASKVMAEKAEAIKQVDKDKFELVKNIIVLMNEVKGSYSGADILEHFGPYDDSIVSHVTASTVWRKTLYYYNLIPNALGKTGIELSSDSAKVEIENATLSEIVYYFSEEYEDQKSFDQICDCITILFGNPDSDIEENKDEIYTRRVKWGDYFLDCFFAPSFQSMSFSKSF